MWKIFKERNTIKGIKILEQKINKFYKEISCKDCTYIMKFISIKKYIIAILDYSVCGHLEWREN